MADPKLVWNQENIRDVAESVGIPNLSDETVKVLAQEVEYRVGQVIVEAMRFMHAGKRTILGTQDISQALKVLDVEPLYGYESTRPLRFGEASLGPGQPLFYIEDEEVDFEKLINAPLPKVPRDVSFTAHWLAVEGVQPSIPQNPTTAEARANELVPKGPGANPTLGALAGNDNVTFKPLVKHVLSRELILYFDKVRAAILDESQDPEIVILRKSSLKSVQSEVGLQQLVPYFVQFVSEKVTHSINNLFVLRQMMELTQSVTENKNLFIEPYIASLVPPILTCLLGRTFGAPGLDNLKEQYQLRDLAASLIGHISNKYSKSSGDLQSRLARTCLKYFLDPTRSLAEHYGAISGITLIGGPSAILTLILPTMKTYEYVLTKAQNERGANDESLRMLIGAIMKGIMTIAESPTQMMNGLNGNAAEGQLVEEYLGSTIGSRVVALGNHKLNKAILDSIDK
ncbi:DUF1546-domain-containing protein [Mollisia scopiformis]|uniref:TBP-associated factor 6 n=1 Tax=Mollisia scopiformis TaxID=149040 RepID=A0A194XBS1_MOLSC|nr:DUF1546-domain-containing protein [Mollisia scopiformis]KUJ17608.1 DUF1546-domain-containing protein [Mollisia scopiformis]